MDQVYNLAIIGAGPAGIAAAVESYLLGMRDIIILEKGQSHNETIRKYYKDNKRVDKDWQGQKVELDGNIYFIDGTKESTLDFFDEVLAKHSVKLQPQTEVQKIVRGDDGIFDVMVPGGSIRARYVVVTIGRMGKPNKPDYKIPPAIRKQVNYTLDDVGEGEKILVVGGGDSAVEYAVDLAAKNDVAICYRRATFRRANPTNQTDIANAIAHGEVRPILNTNIEGLEEDAGKVKVLFEEREPESFDRVIYAIGGTTPSAFLTGSGIGIEEGCPVHDENYESDVPGIFVAGDITQERGGSIALGLNHGFYIARHILDNDKTLRRDDDVIKRLD
ncbi:NAD(P)-binding domain-containing protein [Sulfurimonas sp. HSL-3221]|uniref:NAD(P)-binding domain-containing protein n=1 Tax=Sulfurimonadaceae TaxID=2771471 RepID=UPI001E41A507|nr:NAD(P)-binding domain-containing protein [Sulfurimonas sp. HSL-3221]UFS62885.1 NAD(P)-binding domain-containing protein [Sulfurimonas sp. HSL-3221]